MSPNPTTACATCGAPLAAGTRFCEQCGAENVAQPEWAAPQGRGASPVGLILAAVVAGGLAFGLFTQRERLMGLLSQLREKVAKAAPAPSTPSAPAAAPEVKAAEDLADATLWLQKQPWLLELRRSMPRGVGMTMHAEPYDAEGWSEVSLRETHSADSGYDPNVSPMIGLFRVARTDQRIEWMEPVSGEYVPVEQFLAHRGLKSGAVAQVPASKSNGAASIRGGDFESTASRGPNSDSAVIVADPTRKGNHVACITGPDEMSFDLPLVLPPGTPEATISLRLLHPMSTKIIRFEDGRTPEGIRLRVRLVNDIGNSIIRDAIVRPTGQWREMEFTFYDLPQKVVTLSVEAIWMEGPVYFDDVKLIPTQP